MTVTITGTNDAPVLTAATTGAVTENDETLTVTGAISSTDADDVATATYTIASDDETYGSWSIVDNTWTYTLNNNATVDGLNAGETVTQVATVTVTDDQGATDTETVTVTITGTNDAPTLTYTAPSDITVTEDSVDQTVTGSVGTTDADAGDTHTYSLVGTDIDYSAATVTVAGTYGNFVLTTANGSWTYTLATSGSQYDALQLLTSADSMTDTVQAITTDNSGADNATSDPVTITVNVNGDGPGVVLGSFAVTTDTDTTVTFADTGSNSEHIISLGTLVASTNKAADIDYTMNLGANVESWEAQLQTKVGADWVDVDGGLQSGVIGDGSTVDLSYAITSSGEYRIVNQSFGTFSDVDNPFIPISSGYEQDGSYTSQVSQALEVTQGMRLQIEVDLKSSKWGSSDIATFRLYDIVSQEFIVIATINGGASGTRTVETNSLDSGSYLFNFEGPNGAVKLNDVLAATRGSSAFTVTGQTLTTSPAYEVVGDSTTTGGFSGDLSGTIATVVDVTGTTVTVGSDLTAIAGTYGTLLIDSNGVYQYEVNPTATSVTEATESFSYTDSDGVTTTLEFEVTASAITLNGSAVDANDLEIGTAGGDTIDMSGQADDHILIGLDGIDTITGGDGDDLIMGGSGDDSLTGGDGVDTFKFTLADLGDDDTITDFNFADGGDIVDLTDILSGTGNAADYLTFSESGGDLVLNVSRDGGDGTDMTITFAGQGSALADNLGSTLYTEGKILLPPDINYD